MSYFKNDWQLIANTPTERFESVPFPIVATKASSWQLDAPVQVVVRVQDQESGKITEKIYKSQSRAERFIVNCERQGHIVTSYTNDTMYCTIPFFTSDDDDEDDDCDD